MTLLRHAADFLALVTLMGMCYAWSVLGCAMVEGCL